MKRYDKTDFGPLDGLEGHALVDEGLREFLADSLQGIHTNRERTWNFVSLDMAQHLCGGEQVEIRGMTSTKEERRGVSG